jgi:hypothetical protein
MDYGRHIQTVAYIMYLKNFPFKMYEKNLKTLKIRKWIILLINEENIFKHVSKENTQRANQTNEKIITIINL